jgi:hypothetical protein
MIIVRHRSGPRAGTEDRLDPKLDRIVFGRRSSCEVAFPPEETLVAREHFALVRKPPGPAGHWTIELFGEPFVAVNGIAAEPGQRLEDGATFELGKRGGPSFTVHVEADAASDNLPQTAVQEHDEGARVAAAKAGSAAVLARRIALAGLAAAIVAGAAAAYFAWLQPAPAGISAAVRAHLLRAAFLVEAPAGSPEATAFPVGPHILATNAHVGELFVNLHPGETMLARSPGPQGKTYRVVSASLHPGFEAFKAFVHQDPLRERFFDLAVPGYDVALLRVREDLPQDAILRLAPMKELRALAPGAALATAGYPLERVTGSNVQAYGATPELRIGTIASMTNFFFLPDDFSYDQLLHHDLPTTGGQSGSPIVDQNGNVVALDSAASFFVAGPNKRIPSAVLINYGQRVDLLEELLAGAADRQLVAERRHWTLEFARFSSGMELIDNFIASKVKDAVKEAGFTMVRVSERTESFGSGSRVRNPMGGFQRQVETPVSVAAGAEYVLVGYAHDLSELQLWLYDGGKPLVHAGAPLDTPNHTFAPWLLYKVPKGGKLSAWLIHPEDRDTTYTFQVFRLERKAKTALEQKGRGAAPG